MSDDVTERTKWIQRMLGMPIPLEGMGPLRASPPGKQIDRPEFKEIREQYQSSQIVIGDAPKKQAKVPKERTYDGGKISIKAGPGGTVTYSAPPPPIAELNFAGGGGKGTALVGAVQALQGDTMKTVKRVNGASVGAITSSLLASGITLEELQPIVDGEDTVRKITDGTMGGKLKMLSAAIKNRGSPLTGEGVRELVGGTMSDTIKNRVADYLSETKTTIEQNQDLKRILDGIDPKNGPTFQDMRDLSKIIPQIKEISVSGTYTSELDLSGGDGKQLAKSDKNSEGQLFIFSADTVPLMPVALAVQASAAFPIAFKPVDIDLSKYVTPPENGEESEPWKVRFVDGGVMNNTPTQSSIGNERPLDPMPQEGSLNFVFQGSGSSDVVEDKGRGLPQTPGGIGGRLKDKIVGSKNWAAEYGLSVDAQEHAEDFVVVPLKFTYTKDGKKREVDMSGTLNGTLNFTPDKSDVEEIRKRTREATEQKLKERDQPVTTTFANRTQMLMAISMNDLKKLKDGKPRYPLATAAYEMRLAVADSIRQAQTQNWPEDPAQRKQALATFLGDLDKLADGQKDRAAYIAREIHKANLDVVVDHAGDEGMPPTSVGAAVGLISEAKKVYSVTTRVLTTLIYPKMRDEKKGGASFGLLATVSQALRKAVSWDEVKDQYGLLLTHYRGKSDKMEKLDFLPVPGLHGHGHAEFYKQLTRESKLVEGMAKNG